MATEIITIRVGHSPDPDDAFMFYALAAERIPTGRYRFVHELVDIETLNQRALRGELELTALSFHAYAKVRDRYILCRCGASMGDGYGPLVVARRSLSRDELRRGPIAVPGRWTSAFLALRLYLGDDFPFVLVPFDEIPRVVAEGRFGDQPVLAGLLIHEGQLTFAREGLVKLVDLGEWWTTETGLPLPLGGNAIRRDLGLEVQRDIHRLLRQSIDYALAHRDEALAHAMRYARDLDHSLADQFVGMYVNRWTQELGPQGIEAVRLFLRRGFEVRALPELIEPEFIREA
ncbi:Menaquinone via futalosine step 4 [Thermogutta terrifontis]|uniref:1,4-dihydroxy-6-naphtoate synthase n=1 Tax=Thermogutta terrifontis TaxID=1331910 RepID=A0A286RBM2_9BACT|nr:MqnA/MqnD/SBP family protein [Thermogutta terrifontis]ASV73349.1 Menaquinone via futalosine step 4 [Thermogutta terrifontis]